MLEIRNLYKAYNGKAVLQGLNMSIRKGEVYGFIGKNGAGKSTTMNIICGLISKDSGEVLINGAPQKSAARIPVGYLPESPALLEFMKPREYLSYIAAACRYPGDEKARTDEIIDLVGLSDAADRKIGGYSRGMKQRVGIAAALYAGHELIILDEPTSALDPQGRAEVVEIMNRLKSMGKTIIFSTHILSDVERVATRVGILDAGVLKTEGSVQALQDKYAQNNIAFQTTENDEGLEEKLKGLDYVSNIIHNGVYYVVTLRQKNADLALFRFVAENAVCPILHYNKMTMSLEEIYSGDRCKRAADRKGNLQ